MDPLSRVRRPAVREQRHRACRVVGAVTKAWCCGAPASSGQTLRRARPPAPCSAGPGELTSAPRGRTRSRFLAFPDPIPVGLRRPRHRVGGWSPWWARRGGAHSRRGQRGSDPCGGCSSGFEPAALGASPWSCGVVRGCPRGRWPAAGGQSGVGGRGAESAIAPARAQRGAAGPALASSLGCWSVVVGALWGWRGVGPCLGAMGAPQPPSEILGHWRSMA